MLVATSHCSPCIWPVRAAEILTLNSNHDIRGRRKKAHISGHSNYFVNKVILDKCFVDMVPMAIDYELVLGLERGLDQALREGLQLTGADAHEHCASSITIKRQEIPRRLERLLRDVRRQLRKESI